MKAVIELDVPKRQIGKDVCVCFPNAMLKHGKCELLKEQQPKKVKDFQYLADLFIGKCPSCGEELNNEVYPAFCGFCGQRISWKGGDQE